MYVDILYNNNRDIHSHTPYAPYEKKTPTAWVLFSSFWPSILSGTETLFSQLIAKSWESGDIDKIGPRARNTSSQMIKQVVNRPAVWPDKPTLYVEVKLKATIMLLILLNTECTRLQWICYFKVKVEAGSGWVCKLWGMFTTDDNLSDCLTACVSWPRGCVFSNVAAVWDLTSHFGKKRKRKRKSHNRLRERRSGSVRISTLRIKMNTIVWFPKIP